MDRDAQYGAVLAMAFVASKQVQQIEKLGNDLDRRFPEDTVVLQQARTASELSARLQEFKHIGPVTARICTREIAPIWYGSRRPFSAPR
jgi:hypothetical protein